MILSAKGQVFPHLRLKKLMEDVEMRRESFTAKFFGETDYFTHVGFMHNGLIVQVTNNITGCTSFKYVEGKAFKRWFSYY
jgi:hypothetical protein